MSQTTFDSVNVHRRDFKRHRDNPEIDMQGIRDDADPLDAFPYLEKISVTARKHPYAALFAIVGLVGTVLAALVSACVILFTSFFTMYGEMTATKVELQGLRKDIAVYVSEAKVARTYSASVLARQNFIAGLMSKESQQRLAEYDRANPIIPPRDQLINPDQ